MCIRGLKGFKARRKALSPLTRVHSCESVVSKQSEQNMNDYTDYSNYLDKLHFQELAEKNPEDVIRRTSCRYDSHDRAYEIWVFGSKFRIYPHEMRIEREKDKQQQGFHPFLELFIVHYLLSAKEVEIQNEWISEKDMPGGPTFFRGPHAIPTDLISKRFGNDIQGFVQQCTRLNGRAQPGRFLFCY